MFIYLIVNHVSGKYYVGQHKGNNLKQYLQKKFYDAINNRGGSSRLYRSVRKYGREAFSIHALLSDVQTKVELDAYERDFIDFLKSQDPEYGYNICRGGEGFTGPHSEQAKRKNSEASRLMWKRPEIRENFSAKMIGHPTSEETIEKIKSARALQDEAPRIAAVKKWAKEHPEEMSTRMSRDVHVLGGKAGSRADKQKAGRLGAERGSAKARHTRWHVMRNQPNPACSLCAPQSAD